SKTPRVSSLLFELRSTGDNGAGRQHTHCAARQLEALWELSTSLVVVFGRVVHHLGRQPICSAALLPAGHRASAGSAARKSRAERDNLCSFLVVERLGVRISERVLARQDAHVVLLYFQAVEFLLRPLLWRDAA